MSAALGFGVGSRTEAGLDGGASNFSLGVRLHRLSLRVRAPDVFLVERPDSAGGSGQPSRYYWDTFSNGQRRCRDRSTGQFARSSLCSGAGGDGTGSDEYTGVGMELGYLLRQAAPHVELGAGSKVRGTVLPYAYAMVGTGRPHASHFYGALLTGPDLSAVEIGFMLRVWK